MKRSIVFDEVRIDGILIRDVANAPGCILDDHAHDEVTVGILVEGMVAERRDGEVATSRAGDVFVRRTRVRHSNQYSLAGGRSLFLELEADDPRAVVLSRCDRLLCEDLRPAAQRITNAYFGSRRDRMGEIRKGFEALVADAVPVARPRVPAWLESARDALSGSFEGPVRFQDMARDLRVHPVHFAQAFRAHFRVTPGEFLRAHRVFNAVALASRGVPLAEVAEANGFADQSHMTRLVRAARGAPPARLVRAAAMYPRSVTRSVDLTPSL